MDILNLEILNCLIKESSFKTILDLNPEMHKNLWLAKILKTLNLEAQMKHTFYLIFYKQSVTIQLSFLFKAQSICKKRIWITWDVTQLSFHVCYNLQITVERKQNLEILCMSSISSYSGGQRGHFGLWWSSSDPQPTCLSALN